MLMPLLISLLPLMMRYFYIRHFAMPPRRHAALFDIDIAPLRHDAAIIRLF